MNYSILDYLEHSAAAVPDKCAVVDAVSQYTYAELQEMSRRVGSGLVPYVEAGKPVAVFMEKSADALFCFFGSVYAGSFYTMMNTELPNSRLEGIQSVLKTSTVVTTRELEARAREVFPNANVLFVDELKTHSVDTAVLAKIRRTRIDTDPLYVNFTSGSTGVPKGIVVGHRSVLDFIDCFTELFHITGEDIMANQAPFDFDVSVKDIYSALRVGATLVIVPRELFSAPVKLIDFLCDHKVTTMVWAVSALCLISTFHGLDYKTPETVNKILFSGEVMPIKHLKTWRAHLPNATFVNVYGPTEITCNCTYHVLDPNDDYAAGIPIGVAFPNEDVFLLDSADQKITEPGVEGEICVRGTALALGYYDLPEGRVSGFVRNPLNKAYHEMIYRTGDLAKYLDNGEFKFCGRKDFQIKYMGHRVELEEVDRAMASIPGIERCCCIFDEAKSKLMGFYVGDMDRQELYATMKEKLPVFMIPNMLRKVDSMPLTKNGKIDRKALVESVGSKRAKS